MSLDFQIVSANIVINKQDSLLLGFSLKDQIQVCEFNLKWDANKSELSELTKLNVIEIRNAPKNMMFDKYEEFDKYLVTVPSTSNSIDKNFLFFKPELNNENQIYLEYIGGIEDEANSQISQYELLVSSWTYKDHEKGLLGAAIKVNKSCEQRKHLSLHFYHSETLDKNLVKRNCSQKVKFHSNEELNCLNDIDTLRHNVNIQIMPTSDSITSTNNSSIKEPLTSFSCTLVVKFEAKINVYKMHLNALSNSENKALSVDCNLLFCHDAHKSRILHALQYSTRLPKLFISVDESKELHAWHWQKSD